MAMRLQSEVGARASVSVSITTYMTALADLMKSLMLATPIPPRPSCNGSRSVWPAWKSANPSARSESIRHTSHVLRGFGRARLRWRLDCDAKAEFHLNCSIRKAGGRYDSFSLMESVS